MLPEPKKVLPELKRRLSRKRFRHSVAVAKLAKRLARRYGENPDRAYVAGLLHDWAKELSGPELVRYCRRHGLRMSAFSLIAARAPRLLHAPVSAHMVSRRYGIRNRKVLSAIASHTLGAPRMGILEKILYVADLASPDRRFAEARTVRSLAKKSLDAALKEAVIVKMKDVINRNKILHPSVVTLWNQVCDVKSQA
jgi:predicted HD superfamily hydrolase involved in NAD metabolism